ncbi:DMT family transporter [Pseudomonas sp. MM211]|uniref:DMT family transporter n=1 Tax=Pseudomonas sp. MM211 TaxID=2866808 RepID=UPI001CED4953|nr:DMT family transporter [Pseudomonas sp. MM211]UCJ16698.1 DMT family transporter [Pseudomonas sp. MM211]
MHENSTIRLSPDLPTYLKLALVAIIWGGTFVAGRYMSSDLSPVLLASLRFILAALVLVAFLALSKRGFVPMSLGQAVQVTLLGLVGIYAYNLFFFSGLSYIDASRASLIVASNPALMAICGYLFFRERISTVQMAGIALCLLGAGVVIFARAPQGLASVQGHWLGDALIFGCVLSWVVYSVFCRSVVQAIGALHTVCYSVIAGAVMLSATALFMGEMNSAALRSLSVTDALCLAYLGVLGSAAAYVMYYDAIQRIGATRAGTFIALNPLTAVLAGVLLLDERLSMAMALGGALVILGILLCNRRAVSSRNSVPTAACKSP